MELINFDIYIKKAIINKIIPGKMGGYSMFNEYLTTARILEIIKDDMTFCSSRVILAKLKIEKSGEIISIQWVNSPTVIGITSFWKSKAMECFDRAWECEKGEM